MKQFCSLLIPTTLFLALCACAPAVALPTPSSAPLALTGKTLSVLGDSISSFDGVSNNAALVPSLGANEPFFPQQEIAAVTDTWWQQATDALGLTLLVNNSLSGGWVTADMAGRTDTSGMGRSAQLATARATPDYIAFFMGANDCRFGVAPGTTQGMDPARLDMAAISPAPDFATGYAIAVLRMQAAYPDAIIYCCTLPAALADGCNAETIAAYNEAIRLVAQLLQCRVVDFAADSLITYDTLAQYTLDGLHPNKAGMQQLSAAFVRALQA